MQSSTWGRVVTVLRWIARIFAVVAGGLLGLFALSGAMNYGIADWRPWVVYGVLALGLLALVFWKGIGEVISGLALVGVAIWSFIAGRFDLGGLPFFGSLALLGLLLIACGWYALAQRGHHATHVTA